MSWKLFSWNAVSCGPETTCIEIGTSCSFSLRFWAVTTMSETTGAPVACASGAAVVAATAAAPPSARGALAAPTKSIRVIQDMVHPSQGSLARRPCRVDSLVRFLMFWPYGYATGPGGSRA
jgi:hypothetical protein